MFVAITNQCCQNAKKNDEKKKGKSLCRRMATEGRKGVDKLLGPTDDLILMFL